jgi:hypothetical protein
MPGLISKAPLLRFGTGNDATDFAGIDSGERSKP